MDITLLLSTSITSEYFSLVYTLTHSFIGHVSISFICSVDLGPDDQDNVSS
jgi:hypothetical protein